MTIVERAVLGGQGRVVIPVEVRRALDLDAGAVLTFTVRDDEVVLSTPMSAVRKLQAMFRDAPRGPMLASEELMAERRQEFLREAAE